MKSFKKIITEKNLEATTIQKIYCKSYPLIVLIKNLLLANLIIYLMKGRMMELLHQEITKNNVKTVDDKHLVELGKVSVLTLGIGKWFTENWRHFGRHF